MSSPKLHLSILKGFLVGEAMSDHNGVRCYPAIARETEEKHILKIISVPDRPERLEALLLAGALADEKAALDYFKSLAQDILAQVDILRQLSHQEGFWPYLDGQIDQMDEGTGYEVYLLGTYKRSLDRVLAAEPQTVAGAIHMGLDLCAALAACRRAGYLYADLKPGNIFHDPDLGFRIGDVGFISMHSLKYASLPDKYRSRYTAPELADDMAVLNPTVDIYALGMILYQVFNGGALPFVDASEALPCPVYADYEMGSIICKACHPDPAQRYQDPTELAQALIGYMQQFGAPETAIIPAVTPMEATEENDDAEPVEEFLPEADEAALAQEMAELEEELAFMADLVAGEANTDTENTQDVSEDMVSQDIAEILAQADELIAHELPEPPVTSDPVEVAVVDPDPEEAILVQETRQEADTVSVVEGAPEEATEEEDLVVILPPEEASEPSQDAAGEAADSEEEADETEPRPAIPYLRRIITTAAAILLLLVLFAIGKDYYDNTYLLHVDGLVLDHKDNYVTVQVLSQLEDGKITVVCTDIYGNTRTSNVVNGVAHFTDLNPGTRYTIRIEPVGFHKLVGNTSDSFTTATQTQILSFTAGIGPEDCSVALNFTYSGQSSGNWTVTYGADGIEEKSQDFTGRNVVINGLVEGATYTFTLSSRDGEYVTGQTQVSYLATDILYAQELTITACGGGELTVQWKQPEGWQVEQWQVRCYDEAGYNVTITTSDLSYTFTGLDHSTACTVEVTAEGMSRSVSTSISADPVTITGFNCSLTDDMALAFSWEYTAQLAVENWVLRYRVNGGEEITLQLQQTSVMIMAVPNGNYTFTIETADGNFVFGSEQSYALTQLELFNNYGANASEMSFATYLLPSGKNWSWEDIPEDNFRAAFTIGEKAGILITLPQQPETPNTDITVRFVLHSADGVYLRTDSIEVSWKKIWQDGRCCLTMRYMPEIAGEYILSLYFDGQFLGQQEISIS